MPNARARFVALALLLPAWLPAYATQNAPADVKAIEQVVEAFRTSLINKDKPTYMGLFFSDKPEDIGWQFVSEDVRLQDIRKAKPDAIKARQIPANNFIALIDGAMASPKPKEEKFSNTKIETDRGSPPFSRTLTRRPIKAMRSVHVEAKEVQHRVQARCG